ncbi:MAG: aspartyl/asparaginyl beta-hydroxylase domain-containing protein [Rhodopila sp.]|jgi:hypothetical protein
MPSRFRLIAQGVEVAGVNAELDAHPELWSENAYRTGDPNSVHHGVPDIWLRWRDKAELVSPESYREPHHPVFWPAWRLLPSLHPIVRNLSHVVDSVALGGVLITKIPSGGEVKPHIDTGWHAGFYDTKLYLVLRGNPLCLNYCGDDVESFRAGDVWEFPNSVSHSVKNGGPTDRITVIICFRSTAHDLSQTG